MSRLELKRHLRLPEIVTYFQQVFYNASDIVNAVINNSMNVSMFKTLITWRNLGEQLFNRPSTVSFNEMKDGDHKVKCFICCFVILFETISSIYCTLLEEGVSLEEDSHVYLQMIPCIYSYKVCKII